MELLFHICSQEDEGLMNKKKILFIGGSLNQTSMLYDVSKHLPNYDHYFTPYYSDGIFDWAASKGWLDFTALGGHHRKLTENFLEKQNCRIDYKGREHYYDLIVTSSDLIVQNNIKGKKIILVQEGMTDPENFMYYLVKLFKLPRYLASTSTTGLSNAYDIFCVASEGYKDLFIRKGVNPDKIRVTGIPNFDNVKKYCENEFPHHNFVLVATSDARETLKYENRKRTILNAVKLAKGKQLIFKLHPNENFARAKKEIANYAPGALVYTDWEIREMIANCDTLITQYSSVVYVGLALGKKVYSNFPIEQLKSLTPIQNNGTSAQRIALHVERLIEKPKESFENVNEGFRIKGVFKAQPLN